jgi:soluble lytic murein transglycosylase-like protein
MSSIRAVDGSSPHLREDVVIPALLLAERGIELIGPALRSPRRKAVVSVPLVAIAFKLTLGADPGPGSTPPSARPAWPFASLIDREARRTGLPPSLVAAVIAQESHFDPRARNASTGAAGLMQLAPATARALGVRDPMSPKASVAAGCRYLRSLLDRFHDHLALALAAYNAGPSLVAQLGHIPPYPETRRYVADVISRYRRNSSS